MLTLILFILASIGAALVMYYIAPGAVERWFGRIVRARKVLGSVFTLLVAAVLLMTGSPLNMLIGGALIGLLSLGAVIEGKAYFGVDT